ncbi:MAG: alpha/beta hydrolase [Chlorobia bacterium]|nr:alpha/beta hydrolase [Fimbriimonadaceae bacterium]
MEVSEFIHRFVPASSSDHRTLLLLHGTGGDENDLVPLGQTILPGAAILSPRGRVLEGGMPRFFRRFAEGVFDLDNLREEAGLLASFVESSAKEFDFEPGQVIGVGFSNGANMAHSLMGLFPGLLSGAVLIRAMTTMPEFEYRGLEGERVFLSSGRFDPILPNADAESLARQLSTGGADVTHHWVDAGHNLTRGEIEVIQAWI